MRWHALLVEYFWEPDHVAVMVAVPLLATVLCVAARRRAGRWLTAVRIALGLLLIANEAGYVAWELAQGGFSARRSLPLYLCDIAGVVAGLALIRPTPGLVEVTYFWAFAGTLQGLLTPDNHYPFPEYQFWQYYIDHAGVVLAATLLVVGMRIHPRAGAVRRVFVLTLLCTLGDAVVDLATGADYMYLRAAPSDGSALNLLGPWPWYLAGATAVAVLLLLALDAPFRRSRRAGGEPATLG